ncbi:GNAT family N-acetyltransferase [Kutzneria buriramensis]|uniref:Ribosomal protein S18 acetylase RimI-like enzyme n=1 Tax=Kutzneria buriramensis TaxID=1045776 RepID=A0A3E0I6H5_9PSEU|nr:GNAT family N-acetyltransferase [Kutzneria buriramensis]REH54333.1 ribosomal protein S18 acetylase RimI-like enzyme [Kutzneria buriramensis]
MSIEVEVLTEVTDDVAAAFARLLPQLSTSAAPLSPAALAEIVGHQANTVLVALSDGVVVGTLTLVMYPIPTGLRAHIDDVVVDSLARGKGVGEALTLAAIRVASEAGCRTVDLTSRPSRDAANRLYQRLGFQLRDSNVYRYAIHQK